MAAETRSEPGKLFDSRAIRVSCTSVQQELWAITGGLRSPLHILRGAGGGRRFQAFVAFRVQADDVFIVK